MENEGDDEEEEEDAVNIGDLPARDQVTALLIEVAHNKGLPWLKEVKHGTLECPFNPATGETYRENNFFAAILHMSYIGTENPRYIKEDDI
ncbi:hypothetical protein FACS1894130_05050 [Spirochaetia bacterium]|nr:hypothetical protein FACS1894130_05050 [Spirochaetia bacterium]